MFKQWFGRGNCPADAQCSDIAASPDTMTLDCLQLNETGEIDAVPEESLLSALGFRPGKQVCLRCRTRFGGPVVAEIEGRHTAVARSLARRIRLRNRHASCPAHD